MPCLSGRVIPLDAVNIRAKQYVIQSIGSVVACQGWIAHKVPAGMEGDGLVLGGRSADVIEKYSAWFSDMDPESHGVVDLSQFVHVGWFLDVVVLPIIWGITDIIPAPSGRYNARTA